MNAEEAKAYGIIDEILIHEMPVELHVLERSQ